MTRSAMLRPFPMRRISIMVGRLFVPFLVIAALVVSGCDRGPTPGASAAAPSVPAAWPHPLTAPDVVATHGMVVSEAPLSRCAGADVMRGGGTEVALDAPGGRAFALAAPRPSAGTVSGGGFGVVSPNGRATALHFRETAPAAA